MARNVIAATKWCIFRPLGHPVTHDFVLEAVKERSRRLGGRVELLQVRLKTYLCAHLSDASLLDSSIGTMYAWFPLFFFSRLNRMSVFGQRVSAGPRRACQNHENTSPSGIVDWALQL